MHPHSFHHQWPRGGLLFSGLDERSDWYGLEEERYLCRGDRRPNSFHSMPSHAGVSPAVQVSRNAHYMLDHHSGFSHRTLERRRPRNHRQQEVDAACHARYHRNGVQHAVRNGDAPPHARRMSPPKGPPHFVSPSRDKPDHNFRVAGPSPDVISRGLPAPCASAAGVSQCIHGSTIYQQSKPHRRSSTDADLGPSSPDILQDCAGAYGTDSTSGVSDCDCKMSSKAAHSKPPHNASLESIAQSKTSNQPAASEKLQVRRRTLSDTTETLSNSTEFLNVSRDSTDPRTPETIDISDREDKSHPLQSETDGTQASAQGHGAEMDVSRTKRAENRMSWPQIRRETPAREAQDAGRPRVRQREDTSTSKTHSEHVEDRDRPHRRHGKDTTRKPNELEGNRDSPRHRNRKPTKMSGERQEDREGPERHGKHGNKTSSERKEDTEGPEPRHRKHTNKTPSEQQEDTRVKQRTDGEDSSRPKTRAKKRTTPLRPVQDVARTGKGRKQDVSRTQTAHKKDTRDKENRRQSGNRPPSEELVNLLTEKMREDVQKTFPGLQEAVYFVPPVHFNVARRGEFPAIKGCYVPVSTPESNSRADEAIERFQGALQEALTDRAAFVLSGITFEDVLNKRVLQDSRSPDKLVTVPLPRSADLPPQYRRGEVEMLVVDKAHGILIVDIKAVGDTFEEMQVSEAEKVGLVRKVLGKALALMAKSKDVLLHLVSDIPATVPVSLLLVLPNLSKAVLQRTLEDNPDLKKELERCMLTKGPLPDVCLCAEDLPPKHQAPTDKAIGDLATWWNRRYPSNSPQKLDNEVYETIIGRLCGPYSTITVWTAQLPKKEVRTLGQAVSEAGDRFAKLLLLPQQTEILESQDPFVYLTGPPGSGKTLVLALKGVQWAREGCHVCVLSGRAEPSPIALVIWKQIQNTLKHHQENIDMAHVDTDAFIRDTDGLQTDGSKLARRLKARAHGKSICLIMDEHHGEIIPFILRLRHQLPGIRFWTAGAWPSSRPRGFVLKKLSTPLRCPPSVQKLLKEVEPSSNPDCEKPGKPQKPQKPEWQDLYVTRSTGDSGYPLPTSGVPVKFLQHAGNRHTPVLDCPDCGKALARCLLELGIGKDVELGQVLILTADGNSLHRGFLPSKFVQALEDQGLPLDVIQDIPGNQQKLAFPQDKIILTSYLFVGGLERNVVVFLPGDPPSNITTFAHQRCSNDQEAKKNVAFKQTPKSHECGSRDPATGTKQASEGLSVSALASDERNNQGKRGNDGMNRVHQHGMGSEMTEKIAGCFRAEEETEDQRKKGEVTNKENGENITDAIQEKVTDDDIEKFSIVDREKVIDEGRQNVIDEHKEQVSTEHKQKVITAHKEKVTEEHRQKGTDEDRQKVTEEHRQKGTAKDRQKGTGETRKKIINEDRQQVTDNDREKDANEDRQKIFDENREKVCDDYKENVTDGSRENIMDDDGEKVTSEYTEKVPAYKALSRDLKETVYRCSLAVYTRTDPSYITYRENSESSDDEVDDLGNSIITSIENRSSGYESDESSAAEEETRRSPMRGVPEPQESDSDGLRTKTKTPCSEVEPNTRATNQNSPSLIHSGPSTSMSASNRSTVDTNPEDRFPQQPETEVARCEGDDPGLVGVRSQDSRLHDAVHSLSIADREKMWYSVSRCLSQSIVFHF